LFRTTTHDLDFFVFVFFAFLTGSYGILSGSTCGVSASSFGSSSLGASTFSSFGASVITPLKRLITSYLFEAFAISFASASVQEIPIAFALPCATNFPHCIDI
jgi:hypothetical protein